MRVTQGMLAANSLKQISNSYNKLETLQNQLSTGKKITRPSDDPVVATKGMAYRSNLSEVNQYKRNLTEAQSWFDSSESGLEQVNSILQRTKELVVQGLNGTNESDDRQAIAREIEQLKLDYMQVGNTQVAGNYIFNGVNVGTAPISENASGMIESNINLDPFSVEVSKGIQLRVNIHPENIFGQGAFDLMNNVQTAFEQNDVNSLKDLSTQVDTQLSTLLAERSELGARSNRLELIENRLDSQEITATKMLSNNEDADIEQVITDLTVQESVHRAALGVGAQIIQPTLLDFLR
ncbi:flagellar hook-associated protein FlgL [Priestia megaterium]|jgi:flagellar hook-associated protein 3 FlgL|uniref:Flagellar hook-associated protein 3 n=1 Tax=Priestia megaterium (strain ATCC 14581 / DSM 32 / CCUG 1817 / JCM 2506 / NBRC 15308 / NCIMB 9376 / NCTC 10342 / NRRL B-14308 / VKM B-512 / Ford 19) TaxID=1348623 RepID=A0A0B6AZV9_PRIM2|nr:MULTISPECIES: flagellar hook-associated protein FlgL [Priestia]AJI25464.1 flagellar hook-associated protein 3 [Priestia megaterium NBRC 15308 = ATCC 14581]KFN06930.1 flagellar hook-associated protein 3 [Priestia megaterium]KGJ85439.1 flagellar hook protein FlgL [Priestia megaterium NBRC 15308 = ATCC 14581]MCU7711872.1 flagellar hook-associated protein FlgL [Priestia megaterium]MCW1048617.1 flagellar hook-associated protein FlgL [Priestia sp. JV24]